MLRYHAASLLRRLLRDTGGATAIEYSLMAAGIGGAVATVVWNIGSEVRVNLYDKLTQLF